MQNHLKRSALIIILSVMLLLDACTQDAVKPTPSPSAEVFTPVIVSKAQEAKIVILAYDEKSAYSDIVMRINEALISANQNIKFEIQDYKHKQNSPGNLFIEYFKEEQAAGTLTGDAYPFAYADSKTLSKSGLTMDVSDIVPFCAPVYHAKYKGLFPDKLSGIPMGICSSPVWVKTALMMRKDFADTAGGINTVEGLFQFIDDKIVTPNKPYMILADPRTLVNQWALDNGYYDLGPCGFGGYLYAAVNDTNYAPVALESIPGFEELLLKMMNYYRTGVLSTPWDSSRSADGIGFVKYIAEYFSVSLPTGSDWLSGDFTVQLFSPAIPSYFREPGYGSELVIPVQSTKDKAVEVVRFIEWLYANQQNYDSVIYGAPGIDFNAAGGRYSPLIDGKAPTGKSQPKVFSTWPSALYFYNIDYIRLPLLAPAQIEQLADEGVKQNLRPPFSSYMKPISKNEPDKQLDISEEMKTVIGKRDDILGSIFYADPIRFTKESLASNLQSLADLKNEWLISQCRLMIQKTVDSAKK